MERWSGAPTSAATRAADAQAALVTGAFLVDTKDLDEAEAAVSANFGAVNFSVPADGRTTRTRIWRTTVGQLTLDEVQYEHDMSYSMSPPDKIMLCRVRTGRIEQHLPGGVCLTTGPGGVTAAGALDGVPFAGAVHHAVYDMFVLDRSVLGEVAPRPIPGGRRLGLTSTEPVSAAASQLVYDAFGYARLGVLSNPHAAEDPFMAGALTRYLAAALLSAFPHDVVDAGPPSRRRGDDVAVLVRRAKAYIDDNAHRDISLADVAAEMRVAPDALQQMFITHDDATYSDYWRRVRLQHAHELLVRSDPATTSVASVARRWGFRHATRFAITYRLAYGRSPQDTLRGDRR